MDIDEIFMKRCLELAAKGQGFVSPNPMVGAVLVYEGKIIGEGWHQKHGTAHAEVNCINSVKPKHKDLIAKSKLYVSLEPCSHQGLTPPCSDLIIRESIPEVVIGCLDPNEKVSGRGVTKLVNAGIKVKTGVLESECQYLNRRFFTRHQKQRPFIILKWAETVDGFIGKINKETFAISGWEQQRWVHRQRFQEDAVLVGYHTALNDNPRLNNRHWHSPEHQPLRIVIDFENSLPEHYHLKQSAQKTIIFFYQKQGIENHTEYIKIKREEPIIPQILQSLPNINSMIVEGGAKTLQSFIDSSYWDEIHLWKSKQKFLKEGIKGPEFKHAELVEQIELSTDTLFVFNPQ